MKDKLLIIILVIVFAGLLIVSNIFLQKEESKKINKNGNNIVEDNSTKLNTEVKNMSQNVLEITSENFQKEVLESDKKVLIDFYADWCGPCKKLSPIIEEVAGEESNVKFVKLNIDLAEDIAIEYQVMSIPTLVVMENGKEISRNVGLLDKEEVRSLIK
jgi:thioredoxin 1